MKFNIHKLTVVQLQWLIWACVLLLVFFTTAAEDPLNQAIFYALLNTGFYAAIIYGNISFLFPRFYEKGKTVQYIGYSILYVVSLALMRGFTAMFVYNRYFAKQPEKLTAGLLFVFIAGAVLDFIISLVFRIALAYFKLKQHSEDILLQKSKAELQLLKSQVQPHFLFNTLNNIYYEAYTEAPKTAGLIEKLAEIMRYMVDESTREMVQLSAEIGFLENYIALESIRIRNGVAVSFEKSLSQDCLVPPMLLMPFVENIFKHGIDRSASDNTVSIKLWITDGCLYFQTVNSLSADAPATHGFGLKNLKERLTLLYGANYELTCESQDNYFRTYLKIPVA